MSKILRWSTAFLSMIQFSFAAHAGTVVVFAPDQPPYDVRMEMLREGDFIKIIKHPSGESLSFPLVDFVRTLKDLKSSEKTKVALMHSNNTFVAGMAVTLLLTVTVALSPLDEGLAQQVFQTSFFCSLVMAVLNGVRTYLERSCGLEDALTGTSLLEGDDFPGHRRHLVKLTHLDLARIRQALDQIRKKLSKRRTCTEVVSGEGGEGGKEGDLTLGEQRGLSEDGDGRLTRLTRDGGHY